MTEALRLHVATHGVKSKNHKKGGSMNPDDHPYLSIYLVGCLLAFCLHFVVTAEGYIIGWIFKDNVLRKNLNKIKDPSEQGFKATAMMFVFALVIGTIMSWLGVLLYLWQIFWIPIAAIREVLSSTPEEIKLLKFPLKNNPNLAREAVWAYLYAFNTKGGVTPNAWDINNDLYGIGAYYPSFNKQSALEILGSLRVVDPDILSNAASIIEDKKREWEEVSAYI